MMKKNNSNKGTIARILIMVPVILASVYLISCSKTENSQVGQNDSSKVSVSIVQKEKADTSMEISDVSENWAIDEKPLFPGGDQGLIKYIAENTIYPKAAIENGIHGSVYVRFVVTKTGDVAQAKVMRAVDPILEAEALRVVNSLPKWKPGMNKGQAVNVWFIVPVRFKLK